MRAVLGVVILIAGVSCLHKIAIAPVTQMRDWNPVYTPGHRFQCVTLRTIVDCVISEKQFGDVSDAQVVMFHATEFERNRQRYRIPEKREDQSWILFSMEAPTDFIPYWTRQPEFRNGMFDHVITVSPDLHHDFEDMIPHKQSTLRALYPRPMPIEFPRGLDAAFVTQKMLLLQDRSTPWISVVINNGVQWRKDLLAETMKVFGTQIRSYGSVLNNYPIEPSQGRSAWDWQLQKRNLISKHLFHFAWENSFEPGFVTEKIFDAFMAGTIPIYVGTEDIYNQVPCDMEIEPCFIDFLHYNLNPKSLYNHLMYIMSEPDEYMRYFQWRKHPISRKYKQMHAKYLSEDIECKMCEQYFHEKIKFTD